MRQMRVPCDGVALRRERKAKIGFVDPHQRLTGSDLLAHIRKPFQGLTGDAKSRDWLGASPS